MAEAPSKLPVHTQAKSSEVAPGRRDWPSFAEMRREMDTLFDDFTRDMFRMPSFFRSREPGALAQWEDRFVLQPSVDVTEADGGYRITVELPGMDPKSVDVRVAGDVLTIKGEKSETKEESDRGAHVSERRYGAFSRSFTLPQGVDADAIDASMNNGVLTLRLPKSAEAKAKEKTIKIKAA